MTNKIVLTTISSSSKGNCHILEGNNCKIMLDCGVKAKDIINVIRPSELEAVFITHVHGDHSQGANKLSLYTKCPYYMNEYTASQIELYGQDTKQIAKKSPLIETSEFEVMGFDVYHDVPNTNFLIRHKPTGKKILYITDTSDIRNLHFKKIDYFIVEGNFSLSWDLEDKKYVRTNSEFGHLPIEEAIDFVKKNKYEDTIGFAISHISHSFKEIEQFEEMAQKELPDIKVKALKNRTYETQTTIIFEEE